MVSSSISSRETCRSQPSSINRMDGRHVGTRTPDLYRVNFEVNNLKPFPHLAFPHSATPENSSKKLGFDGELMASPCLAPARFLIVGVMAMLRQLRASASFRVPGHSACRKPAWSYMLRVSAKYASVEEFCVSGRTRSLDKFCGEKSL